MKSLKIKVIYIISNIDKALAFEWIADKLDRNIFDLSFILLNPGSSVLETFLHNARLKVFRFTYTGKNDIPGTFIKIYKILRKEKPDAIHTHLFDASLIGLAAGKLAGVPKRVFTRHHGNQHHVYFPRAVRYDKLMNALATTIVAPSASVKDILVNLEKVKASKVKVVHHGFDLSYFNEADTSLIEELRKKYNPAGQQPVIGVISRYTELKGIQYIIPAFRRVLEFYPDALLILANATGDYKKQIQALLESVDERNYIQIPFEQNISALYKIFDIFIHTPVEQSSEAFGQTYIEALAAGVPSIFTLSGVANEFIADRRNALVVPFKDADAIYNAILALLEDKTLQSALIRQGKQDVSSNFGLSLMIKSLEDIYAG